MVYSDRLNDLKGNVDNFTLYEAGLITTPFHNVKVIARGDLTAKITLQTQGASQSVVAMLEKAGGAFEKAAVPPLPKSAKQAEADDKAA